MTEWNAAGYARISALQKAMADEALSLVSLRGAERVLDVGCGEGKITAQIAERVPRGNVVGVDPSQQMIAFAREHFPPARLPNLRFDVADARSLPYRSEFDLVVSFNALHWIPDQDAALRSILRTMKRDARALFRLVPAGARKSLETLVEETRAFDRWRDRFVGFSDPYLRLTPDEYRATAERNGFRVLSMKTHSRTWDFGSREAFFAFCSVGLVAWTARVPDSDRDAFVDDVLTRYARISGDPQVFMFYQMDIELAPAAATAT